LPRININACRGDRKSPLLLHMDIISSIKQWTEAALEEGYFLVEAEQKPGSKKISVFIDGDTGVNIETCRLISKVLSEQLDELDYGDGAYYLEVSSPGVDRPLVLQRQYPKHVGRELQVKLTGNNEITGKLKEVTTEGIVLLLKDKKKGYKEAAEKAILFKEVKESNVLISFK
jgi:ribosome maturation factor RimP